ncbi:MAG: YccF domain-containing protein [Propionivibrio sp.]|nr:YccF domain-containing protein [Propionivibrio sp.]MBK9026585.1 YccF domain-containing protein [Propionivibrio sp.]
MSTIGNILWLILGGLLMGLGWWLVGLLAFVSIIGIPWGKACFVIGQFAFLPFGKEAVSREELSGQSDIGTGVLGLFGNIVWFLLAGVWLAIGHVISAAACFVTIIGIPFGIQHLKLAAIALAPIGKTIVNKEVAAAMRGESAQSELARLRQSN